MFEEETLNKICKGSVDDYLDINIWKIVIFLVWLIVINHTLEKKILLYASIAKNILFLGDVMQYM